MISYIKNFIKKHTTGVPFIIFFSAGVLMIVFFWSLYLLKIYGHLDVDRLIHVDFEKIKYALIFSAIWFIISDVAKKKELFFLWLHFILDTVFYLTAFGSIVYFTNGLHGGLFPLLYLAAIGAAIFGTVMQTIVFLIILSAETYLIYFLTEEFNDLYHFWVITIYVLFYFVLTGFIKYFYKTISENEKKYKELLDISQRAEKEIRESEQKYSDLIESTPLCIKVFDENRKMIFLNKGGREEHFIKDTDDISKWDWIETIKKEYHAEAIEKFQRAFTKGEISTLEFEHTPEGSTHEWCSSLISPIKDKDGKVKSVLFLSSDITALKKAELEARRNEQMFKTLLDATPLCIKWFDEKGNLISVNRGAREEHYLEKLNNEEIRKWDYLSCIEKNYHSLIKEKMNLALKKGESSSFLMKHALGTSKSMWCESSIVPIKNEKGETNYVLFLSRDVTQEKSIEEERKKNQERSEETKIALFNILEDVKDSEKILQEERDKSQAIISSMGESLVVVDADYKIVLMNSAAEKIFEVSASEGMGKDLKEIVSVLRDDKELPPEERPVMRVFKTGEVVQAGIEDNFYIRIPSGKKIPVSFTVSPLFKNGTTAAIIIFRDISDEKALDESKNSFISIASHQLRTPLTSIRWYAEMLDSEDVGALNKDQKDFVGRIYGGALKLNEVINLLLSLSRIESGKLGIEKVAISLSAFTEDVIKELEPQIKQKNIDVKIIMSQEKLPEIVYDASVLRQIVVNLLSNSIRYTDNGGKIEIAFEKTPGEIVYSVKDDGIGVPVKNRDKIFTKFFRAENAITKVPDGSGLGLSLVKALVEMNKGLAWFESPATWVDKAGKEEKKGTVFHFTIPL